MKISCIAGRESRKAGGGLESVHLCLLAWLRRAGVGLGAEKGVSRRGSLAGHRRFLACRLGCVFQWVLVAVLLVFTQTPTAETPVPPHL